MKIKSAAAPSKTLFSDLSFGDVFRYADTETYGDLLYLRTDDTDADCETTPTNAVNMATGAQVAFVDCDVVVRVQGSFVVEGGAK